MEDKTITFYPAPIDNKNIVEDWIEEFMGGIYDNFLNLSNGARKRKIGAPFGDDNIIECTYNFGDNKIVFKAYGLNDRFNKELFIEKVVVPLLENEMYIKLQFHANGNGVTCYLYH